MNSKTEAALSASIKYFLLSALSTSFLLLGVALLYGITGSTNYDSINAALSLSEGKCYSEGLSIILPTIDNTTDNLVNYHWLPITLIVLTLLFKLGAAPFYNWSPDLYDSIPTPITVWMTTIVKISILLFIAQPSIIKLLLGLEHPAVETLFIIAGILSLIVGSVGLGAQWRMKRFLAYSAISHLGFIL
jgi:NADH-quinone oxidoreductase subunit N